MIYIVFIIFALLALIPSMPIVILGASLAEKYDSPINPIGVFIVFPSALLVGGGLYLWAFIAQELSNLFMTHCLW